MLKIVGKPTPPPVRTDGRTETTEPLVLPGLLRLVAERECTIKGLGRCRYKSAMLNEDGTVAWVNVIEAKRLASRSVTPDRITKVHSTIKMRGDT